MLWRDFNLITLFFLFGLFFLPKRFFSRCTILFINLSWFWSYAIHFTTPILLFTPSVKSFVYFIRFEVTKYSTRFVNVITAFSNSFNPISFALFINSSSFVSIINAIMVNVCYCSKKSLLLILFLFPFIYIIFENPNSIFLRGCFFVAKALVFYFIKC